MWTEASQTVMQTNIPKEIVNISRCRHRYMMKYETLNPSPQIRSQNKQTINGTNSAAKQDDPTKNNAHLNQTR
jgi:hypothetical protein